MRPPLPRTQFGDVRASGLDCTMDTDRNVAVSGPVQRACERERRPQRNLKTVTLDCVNGDLTRGGRAVAATLACKSACSVAEERAYSLLSDSEDLSDTRGFGKYYRQL